MFNVVRHVKIHVRHPKRANDVEARRQARRIRRVVPERTLGFSFSWERHWQGQLEASDGAGEKLGARPVRFNIWSWLSVGLVLRLGRGWPGASGFP